MSSIKNIFQPGKKALIPYITVGYPDVATTLRAGEMLANNGADIIELGVPFSDPMADGLTIQAASFQSLHNGVSVQTCLEVAAELRKKIKIPLMFMSYLNPLYKYGLERFCEACFRVGVDGLIIPDLPPEEAGIIELSAERFGIDIIYLLAPDSDLSRIRLVGGKTTGFIYLVSEAGVTGTRNDVPAGLEHFIERVRRETGKPLCVGFGISTPEQAGRILKIADGVIIGSKIIQTITADTTLEKTEMFIQSVKKIIEIESRNCQLRSYIKS